MKKLLIFTLIIIIVITAVSFYLNPFSHMKAYVLITPSPVSLDSAKKECPISLPSSASNIQYGIWSLWQASMTYVRFEAPVRDCLEHAEKGLYEDAKAYGLKNATIVSSTNFPEPEPPNTLDDFDVDWFDVKNLSNGIKFELEPWLRAGGSPIVYIDQERGIFYYSHFD